MKIKKRKNKAHGLSSLENLDNKIIRLQKATKGDLPYLTQWHIALCRRSPLYYAWHQHPNAESIHLMILTLLGLYSLWLYFLINQFILIG